MAQQQQPIRQHATSASEIPDKLYFRIGEVARLCDVPAYVLRFWETEFPQLRPNKGGTGQRLFRRRDVEMALRIKHLLYDEGYTIPGARQLLRAEQRQRDPQLTLAVEEPRAGLDREQLQSLRREMHDLLTLLSQPTAAQPATAEPIVRRPRPLPPENLFRFAGHTRPAKETKEV